MPKSGIDSRDTPSNRYGGDAGLAAMRAIIAISLLIVPGAMAVSEPESTTEAVGICVVGALLQHKPCAGLVCYGYTGGAWQNCMGLRP